LVNTVFDALSAFFSDEERMMKGKLSKKVLPVMMAIILGTGVISSASVFADSNEKEKEHSADSDYRGDSGETKKITICHVPKGNPSNRHTIHIGYSAWSTHRDNHGGDYLGSCNNPPSTKTNRTTTIKEDTLVISDCTGETRKTLLTLTQSYFDPIIVNDDAFDDETTVTALSQCLDKGDSSDSSKSDSSKNKPDSGKGRGHDSVSDSGNHHRISGCKNEDSSDSNHDSGDSNESDSSKNYAKKLREKNDKHNKDKGHGDSSLNISDSSMDDSGVYKEYKKCADSSGEHHEKTGRGDSGHKYREMANCSNAKAIKEAVKKHHKKVEDAKYEKRAIVIKKSSLIDKRIKAAVDACTQQTGNPPVVIPPSGSGDTQGFSGRLNWKEKSQ